MKIKRPYTPLSEAEIDLIILEAELTPPSDEWEFCTEEDLRFIKETIRINGSIKIEEY